LYETRLRSTGANQGIGYETAKNLLLSSAANAVAEGVRYHVIIGSRDEERGFEAAAKLRQEAGGKGTVEALQLDGKAPVTFKLG
jgi:NAD(P)-dependent dehydrogenase (short-subunit alcohol dehydrogenase family)